MTDFNKKETPPENKERFDKFYNLSIHNKTVIEKEEECGCYRCLKIFSTKEIKEFLPEEKGEETAICPYCGHGALLTKKMVEESGERFDQALLKELLVLIYGPHAEIMWVDPELYETYLTKEDSSEETN